MNISPHEGKYFNNKKVDDLVRVLRDATGNGDKFNCSNIFLNAIRKLLIDG